MSGKREGNIPGTWATTLIEIQSAGRPGLTIPRQFPYALKCSRDLLLNALFRKFGDVPSSPPNR
jgi:hypothetical protein